MPFRRNYRRQRTERDLAKEQRKQEKLLKRQETVAKRKAARDPTTPSTEEPQEG